MIIPLNLYTVPRSLAMNHELTEPSAAVQTQDVKVSPRCSELAVRVSGGCKKVLVNRKKR